MRVSPLLVLAPLVGCAEEGGESGTESECSIAFAATVNSGPSLGTELMGTLRFHLDAQGALTGEVETEDGTAYPVSGSADMNAINLAIALSDTALIYGVGTSDQPVAECTGTFGGPFTGPQEGDAGDWLARSFAVDGSTPSYDYSQ